MDKVRLGKTDLEVSKLGFGALFVRSQSVVLEDAKQTVRRAVELGVNYLDTAPNYGDSEEVLGKALAELDSPVIISTKLGGWPKPFDPQDPQVLRRSVENSLVALGREQIDMLMVHEPDRPREYDWWTDFVQVEGPVLSLLEDLKREGLVRYSGIGGTGVTEMTHLVKSGKFDVLLTAFNYSLLWREAELELLPAAREMGMGIVAGSALLQGALARRYDTVFADDLYWLNAARKAQFRALYDFQAELDLPLAELALRFVAHSPLVDCVLMGARSVAEAEQNCSAVKRGPLPPEVLVRLDEIAAQLPYRPFEEPAGLGWYLRDPRVYKGPGRLS